ncbi:MAG TPA: hypothetical protein VF212_06590 [Longimicrobiales bacterium]
MERRNLDFGIEVTPDQWAELGRAADALGDDEAGFRWDEDHFDEIRVMLRDADAPDLWRDWVSAQRTYGAAEREVALFRFNGGRPFAELELPDYAEQPVVSEDEESAMQRELEQWLRGKWRELLRGAGLHYDRGHLPQG